MKNRYQICQKVFLLMAVLFSYTAALAQEFKISGKVTDEKYSEGLPGVTVKVKGTLNNGTITDFEGNYSLTVASDKVILQFSSVGYATKEVELNGRNVVNIVMSEDVKQLDEVVVVGYGTQTKREITGAIVKLDNEAITSVPTPSFESALQGKAAGVQVITGSGMAGSGAVVRVRGIASVGAGGDPLYVIDGIPINNDQFLVGRTGGMNPNPLASINPNDIESVEILKDAAATGIYGSRAANGVILITTKRGEAGKPKFSFSSRMGVSEPTNNPDMMNSQEWLQMYKEAWQNDGNLGVPQDLPGDLSWEEAQQNDTDWWDAVTQQGFKQEYNLSMSQGTDKLSTYASLGYSDNESYMIGNKYRKTNARATLNYKPFSVLELKGSSSFAYGVNDLANEPWEGGPGVAMSTALPIYPIYNEDGSYFTAGGSRNNPVFVRNHYQKKNDEIRSINTFEAVVKPLKDLTFNVNAAYDFYTLTYNEFQSPTFTASENLGFAKQNSSDVHNFNSSLYGTYSKTIGDHKLTLMTGFEYQFARQLNKNLEFNRVVDPLWVDDSPLANVGVNGTFTRVIDESTGETEEYSVLLGEDKTNSKDKEQRYAFMSYYGRLNYMYKRRYVAQFTARMDGSSRFGKNNKLGFFPTVSASWIVSEEPFLKDNSVISNLKLRTSYGITGNSNIGNYNSWGTFTQRVAGSYYNGVDNQYIHLTRFPNQDLQWESVHNFDAGLEAGFLEDRFVAEFGVYYKRSNDVLMEIQPAPSIGAESNYIGNLGVIENKGFEFSLTSRNIVSSQRDGFTWTTNLNLAHNTNKVLDDGGINPDDLVGGTNDTRVIEGYPVGTNYLVRFSHVDPATGRPVWLDKDGRETFEYSRENSVPTGNVVPDMVGGVTNTFTYKGLDLSFLFSFRVGGNIFDSSAKRQMGKMSEWNFRRDRLDYWRKPGDEARYPVLTSNGATYGADGEDWFNSTLWLYDASYVRLRNVTLGYTFSPAFLSKANISGMKVFVTGSNLLTFTKFPGVDPEIARDFDNPTDRNLSPNISWLTPPQEQAFILGLNLTF